MKSAMQIIQWNQSALRVWTGPTVAHPAKLAPHCLVVLCFFITGLQQVAAQPTISVQPSNASALLGQDAQFTVTASGTMPLIYQWRLDGRVLAGATNPNLTVTNVSLGNLGRYDVVISDRTGAVTSNPAWLLLARWTELVVFGRSHDMPICGSLVWPDDLANRLGVRLRNYAATVGFNTNLPSTLVRPQIAAYLTTNTPTTNTLIALWQGSVDVIYGRLPVAEAVSNQLGLTRLLVAAGARSFLMPTMWPPELIPFWVANPAIYPNLTRELIMEYNTLLSHGLKGLQAEYPLAIYRPDMFAFFTAISEDPAAYGFSVPLGSDFTCDTLHFTPAVHRLASQEFHLSLTPPLRIISAARRLGDEVVLNWSGGSPPFRIERTTDLRSSQWEAVGEPGFASSVTMKTASPREYFRVLRLGQ